MADGSGDQRESSTARQRGDGRPRPPLVHSNTEYYIKHTNSPETNRYQSSSLTKQYHPILCTNDLWLQIIHN